MAKRELGFDLHKPTRQAYVNLGGKVHYLGDEKSEQTCFELACRPMSELYSTLNADEFEVVSFSACREWWLSDPKRSRQYVNRQMKRLVHVFKWGAGEGLISATVYQTLACVATLKKGRMTAKDAKPVLPVSDATGFWTSISRRFVGGLSQSAVSKT